MKIIGGALKGRNFYMPAGIRPSQNIVRKSLFDILGQDLEGVEFLYLFSGSGAMGLEALSRNANRVVFVEKERSSLDVIYQNLKLLGEAKDTQLVGRYEVVERDAFWTIKDFARQGRKFDIVFADPPYDRQLAKKTLKTLEAYDILQPNWTVVIQHDKREILPEDSGRFSHFREKKYGSSVLSIYTSE